MNSSVFVAFLHVNACSKYQWTEPFDTALSVAEKSAWRSKPSDTDPDSHTGQVRSTGPDVGEPKALRIVRRITKLIRECSSLAFKRTVRSCDNCLKTNYGSQSCCKAPCRLAIESRADGNNAFFQYNSCAPPQKSRDAVSGCHRIRGRVCRRRESPPSEKQPQVIRSHSESSA